MTFEDRVSLDKPLLQPQLVLETVAILLLGGKDSLSTRESTTFTVSNKRLDHRELVVIVRVRWANGLLVVHETLRMLFSG